MTDGKLVQKICAETDAAITRPLSLCADMHQRIVGYVLIKPRQFVDTVSSSSSVGRVRSLSSRAGGFVAITALCKMIPACLNFPSSVLPKRRGQPPPANQPFSTKFAEILAT